MSVYYEWVIEWIEFDSGDIIDLDHRDTYAEAVRVALEEPPEGTYSLIGLVRNASNGRTWAYMDEGFLPHYFRDAYGEYRMSVPKRFLKEVEKCASPLT